MLSNVSASAAHQLLAEWRRRHGVRPESFLHAIPDLLFLINRDGTYIDFQPAKDVQPYVPPSEFLGKRVLDVMPDAVGVPCQYLIGEALATGQMQCMEYQLLIGAGTCHYEARILP